MSVQGTPVDIDLRRLPGPHKHIALVPQWDFLELLATAAAAGADVPAAAQHRGARARSAESGVGVVGVRYRGADGSDRRDAGRPDRGLRRPRSRRCAAAMGLQPRSFGAPMDVWWFRLPRNDGDPPGLNGVLDVGPRDDRHRPRRLLPDAPTSSPRAPTRSCAPRASSRCSARVADAGALRWRTASTTLTSFDDVKLLDVQLNRLRRWYTDGLLLIGDAAHAMSPVGGVGINLAVADAVAAARILAGPLRAGRVSTRRAGARPGPAVGARGADPGGAAADPRARVIAVAGVRRRLGPLAAPARSAIVSRGAVPAHACAGYARGDRPASRARARLCQA